MNEFQAAMGICNLKYIETEIDRRKEVFNIYVENLGDVKGIRVPTIKQNVKHNYACFPVLIEEAFPLSIDELFNLFTEKQFNSRKYFFH